MSSHEANMLLHMFMSVVLEMHPSNPIYNVLNLVSTIRCCLCKRAGVCVLSLNFVWLRVCLLVCVLIGQCVRVFIGIARKLVAACTGL